MKILVYFLSIVFLQILPASGLFAQERQLIRLRDGEFIFGEVLEHDESGIRVRRMDNGGVVDLKWTHLFPAEEQEMRERFGYLDRKGEEVTIQAQKLILDDGTERIGILADRTEKDLILKVKGSFIPIPKSRVSAPIEQVEVNALDLFTKDQLYEMKWEELNPQTAEDYLELGRYLVRIRDPQRALAAYQKVRQLDASAHPEEVSAALRRLEIQAAQQEEVEWVDSVDIARGRGELDKALELCSQFVQKWPRSTFLQEVHGKKVLIEKERAELLAKTVARRWYVHMEKIARELSMNRASSVEETQNYIQTQMPKEILDRVLEDAGKVDAQVTGEKVQSLWKGREKFAKMHVSTYGNGTFLLGAARAQQGIVAEKEGGQKKESQEDKELRERVKRYIDQYLKAKKGAGGASEEDAAQAWWSTARAAERHQWILSYYAEFGGDMQMVRPAGVQCQTCGGQGSITIISAGRQSASDSSQGTTKELCPVCQGVQIQRRVYYK